ncbi:hypothetical protein [Prosthecobacter sp.]|uniref:hypothetical protein n=1 Tax=Prosthecobacter sp. TaxID=1965333 RepID=UPI0037830C87
MKHIPVVFFLLLGASPAFAADPPTAFATIQFDSDFKYPAYASSLIYKGREVEELTLQFIASKPPLFKLQAWRPGDPKRTDLVTEVGKKFGGLRSFTLLKHTAIQGFSQGQPADLSELELREEGTGKRIVLRKGAATTLPASFARFAPTATTANSSALRIKEGTTFLFPNHPEAPAELIAVLHDRVRVRCEEKDFDLVLDVEGCENLRVYGGVQKKAGEWTLRSVYADVPKDLLLDRSGKKSPFPLGVPSNLQYKSSGFDIIVGKVIAGPKCITE